MRILLDTNVLTRSAQASHPHHSAAVSALVALTQRRDTLCVVSQVFYEFWVVATRPIESANGLGFTVAETQSHMEDFAQAFTVLDDSTESAVRLDWSKLVLQGDVKGKAAHDVRLIAAMNVYGLTSILTFNRAHFTRYPVEIISPVDVAQNP